MPRFLTSLSLAALLATATALSAQDTGTTAAPQTEAPAEGTAQTDGEAPQAAVGLDTGRVVQENPAFIREEHDDWQIKCFPTEGGEDLCQMYQLLTEEAGNPVAEFSIYRLPPGGPVVAGATLAVPLGTLLTEEVKLSIDAGKAKSYAYSFCTMGGCFSRIGLSQADVDALKGGVTATLEIVPAQAPDQKVRIKASLKGFTAAFEAASVLKN